MIFEQLFCILLCFSVLSDQQVDGVFACSCLRVFSRQKTEAAWSQRVCKTPRSLKKRILRVPGVEVRERRPLRAAAWNRMAKGWVREGFEVKRRGRKREKRWNVKRSWRCWSSRPRETGAVQGIPAAAQTSQMTPQGRGAPVPGGPYAWGRWGTLGIRKS